MRTFVISIERNESRFEFLKTRLHHLNFDFEKIVDVDGANITEEDIHHIDTSFYFDKFGIRMSKYEICCALSHRKVYQKMVDDDIEKALI